MAGSAIFNPIPTLLRRAHTKGTTAVKDTEVFKDADFSVVGEIRKTPTTKKKKKKKKESNYYNALSTNESADTVDAEPVESTGYSTLPTSAGATPLRMKALALRNSAAKEDYPLPTTQKAALAIEDSDILNKFQNSLDVCPICSMPDAKRKSLEYAIFVDHKAPAALQDIFPVTAEMIEKHTIDCIITRDTFIPASSLTHVLLTETRDYVQMMQKFKRELDSTTSVEGMFAYGDVLFKLTHLLKALSKEETPKKQGVVFSETILKPLVLVWFEEIIREVNALKKDLHTSFKDDDYVRKTLDIKLNTFVLGIGDSSSKVLEDTKQKLAEMLGVLVEEIT